MDVNNVAYVTRAPPVPRRGPVGGRANDTEGDEAMTHSGPPARRTGAWILVTILLLVAVLGTLIVPIYTRSAPKLGSFPFFYWYQLLWVPVVALLTTICYLITTRVARAAPDAQRGPASSPPLSDRGEAS
jgi:Protein of unknown function (DUF3311)